MGSSFETNVEVYSIRWRSDHDLGYHAKCRDLNLLLAYMDFFPHEQRHYPLVVRSQG